MARFLIDADLPRSARGKLQLLGHEAIDLRDTACASAEDLDVVALAVRLDAILVTGNPAFLALGDSVLAGHPGIAVVDLAVVPSVRDLANALFRALGRIQPATLQGRVERLDLGAGLPGPRR